MNREISIPVKYKIIKQNDEGHPVEAVIDIQIAQAIRMAGVDADDENAVRGMINTSVTAAYHLAEKIYGTNRFHAEMAGPENGLIQLHTWIPGTLEADSGHNDSFACVRFCCISDIINTLRAVDATAVSIMRSWLCTEEDGSYDLIFRYRFDESVSADMVPIIYTALEYGGKYNPRISDARCMYLIGHRAVMSENAAQVLASV